MRKKKPTVEWAPFTLKPGESEEDLLKASQALQQGFLQHQKGFLKRELLKKSDREYIDMVYWQTQEDAHSAIANAEKSPACFAYFQLMEDADHAQPGVGVLHFKVLSEY